MTRVCLALCMCDSLHYPNFGSVGHIVGTINDSRQIQFGIKVSF